MCCFLCKLVIFKKLKIKHNSQKKPTNTILYYYTTTANTYFIFQITLTNLISVDERLVYTPHPDNPEA